MYAAGIPEKPQITGIQKRLPSPYGSLLQQNDLQAVQFHLVVFAAFSIDGVVGSLLSSIDIDVQLRSFQTFFLYCFFNGILDIID